ncbi:MAG TPA: GGDEF domain-containing protein [Solimonas sp.]|nr:GGDEF domain-containing protein [Solimonas sp.]
MTKGTPHVAAAPPAEPLEPAALREQLRIGFGRLRFAPPLEHAFRRDFEQEGMTPRLVLALVAMALVATQPLFDAIILHPPAGFAELAHTVQFGLQLPLVGVAALVTWWPRWRAASVAASILASLALAAGVIYQRRIGADFGFAVPPMLVGVIIAAMFFLGGLRFWQYLPAALLVVAVFAWNEIDCFGNGAETKYSIQALAMLAMISAVGGYFHEYHARSIWLQRMLLEAMSLRDPLTALLNSRAFREAYQRLFALMAREQRPLLVAVIDVDCFKEYNDRYGHSAGDDVLTQIAGAVATHARRGGDLAGRIGGEEFALALPDADPAFATARLEQLREAIERLAIPHETSLLDLKLITVSIGALWAVPPRGGAADSALFAADMRLYESKRNGRNRVSLARLGALDQPAGT